MKEKINSAMFLGYIKTKMFITEFKEDENAMEIVQVVILVLVGMLLIVGLWGALSGWLPDMWERIIGDNFQDADSFDAGSL